MLAIVCFCGFAQAQADELGVAYRKYVAAGKFRACAVYFTKIVRSGGPTEAFTHALNCRLALSEKKGKLLDTITGLMRSADADPANTKIVAELKAVENEYIVLEGGTVAQPKTVKVAIAVGENCLKNGCYYTAVRNFTAALDHSNLPEIYKRRGQAYMQIVNGIDPTARPFWAKARADFNRAISLTPESDKQLLSQLYEYRGTAAHFIGLTDPPAEFAKQYETILADYDKAIELKKEANYYYARGMFKSQAGKKELAVVDLTEAIRLEPTNITFYIGRSLTYIELGITDEAKADQKKSEELRKVREAGKQE